MTDYNYFIKENQLVEPSYKLLKFSRKKNLVHETRAFTKRLYLQIYRKPSSSFASITQSLLWLILFSALFYEAPINITGQYNIKYFSFISYGLIIFTAFGSSINAGLPVIFDREFGFFNRILTSPLNYKSTILFALLVYAATVSIIQVICMIITSTFTSQLALKLGNFIITLGIASLITFGTAATSITVGLILPGHIEFLAFTLLINLPTLFSSTIIAPLKFMPCWLQILACINPLTYATEIVRYLCINKQIIINTKIIETVWFQLNLTEGLTILIVINIISFVIAYAVLQYKYN
uniref:ABC transmembrane type-2 domain-containing protein n=1 Tax=Caloglossa intermedia TaxID=100879 RepID=A0A1Z1M6M9_9FLOR|nr:hypothetical protein [Caloglossa intermedia]ARW61523.1 hypothetical protein [Caloglossa intermedia]